MRLPNAQAKSSTFSLSRPSRFSSPPARRRGRCSRTVRGMAPRLSTLTRLLTFLFGVALLATACADSDDSTAASTTRPSATTGPSVSTGGGEESTTSTAPTETTPAETTEQPTTEAPATTAGRSGGGDRPEGLVALGDGLGPLAFGVDPETAIDFLSAALGPATNDSGWVGSFSPFGTCPGTQVRGVEWPGLLALFGDAADDYSDGSRHFMSWSIGYGGIDVLGLATSAGLAIGDDRATILAAYPAAEFFEESDSFLAAVDIASVEGQLFGYMEDGEHLSYLTAGTLCGE
jgi:hypothetical protein